MKQFMFIVLDSKRNIVAVYDKESVVKKLKPHLEDIFQDSLVIEKVEINRSITLIKELHDRDNHKNETTENSN